MWRSRGEPYHSDSLVQTDRWVEGVTWCGARAVFITEQHSMFAVAELKPFTTGIRSCEITSFPPYASIGKCTHFSKTTPERTQFVTVQYLANNNVPLLEWPARSPDLSPIEYICDYLDQRISRRPIINNIRKLENALQQVWNAIPKNTIRRLIGSMRSRIWWSYALLTFYCDSTFLSRVDELKLIND